MGRLYLFVVTVCILLSPTSAWAFQKNTNLDQRYAAALEQANRLKFNEAMAILRSILYEDPMYVAAHVRLADIYQHQWARDFVNARKEAAIADSLKQHLSAADRLFLEAVHAKIDQRFNEALDALNARVEQWPEDRQALFDMAERAFYTGNRDTAVDMYHRLLGKWPDYTPALNHLAYSVSPEDGIPLLEKAVTTEPKEPDWRDSLGDLYRAAGRTEDAIEQYQKAVHIDPGFTIAWGKLAGYYVSKNRFDEAVAAYTQKVKYAPSPAERASSYNALWLLRIQQEGKSAEVFSDIRSELEDLEASGGNNPGVLAAVARGYRLIGDRAKAKQAEESIAAVDPEGPQIQMLRIQASGDIKDPKERAEYMEAFRMDFTNTPYTEIVLLNLFSAYSRFAEDEKVRRIADELLGAVRMNMESAKQMVATAFADRHIELDRAQTLAEEAMATDIQRFEMMKNVGAFATVEEDVLTSRETQMRARHQDTQGWVALAQGRIDAAEKLFRKAYKATERAHITGAQQLYHLGVLAERQDQTEEAEIFYLRAVTHHSESAGARDALIALAAQRGKSTEEVEQMIAAWREETVKEEGERLLAERINEPAPDFSLKDFDGNIVSLSALKGKVVLIDFWATWCYPCKLVLPLYQQVHEKYKDWDVICLAISVDGLMSQGEVAPFIKENNYTFPVLIDVGGQASQGAYKVHGIPTLFVIDKTGKIQYMHVGYNKKLVGLLSMQIEQLVGW